MAASEGYFRGLLDDICANIRAIEPAEMKDKKLVYSVYQACLGGVGLIEEYKGKLVRKNGFFRLNTKIASFRTNSYGRSMEFHIFYEPYKKPIEAALEKHKDKFGKIDIRHGPKR